ncbi:formylglycine-generating enzyme family protein [Pseudanabaena cinerea]|nr:formylglycine-generating enzyme family protein [Pseudanabaena cinerea]
MWDWKKVKEKTLEIGGKIIGGIAESFGLSFGKKVFGIAPHGSGSNHDAAIATAISSNSIAMKAFADAQNSLVAVQAEQNKLQKARLVLNAIELVQKAELAQKERELKEKLCEITCNLQRELQQNEFQNRGELQAVQIQSKWDEKELPTIFSRRELTDIFAQKSDFPLFICSKIQITEGSPKYFQTELAAELESKMLTFANSTFRRDVRFYSRFFKDRDVFDVNAAQLETILPNTPCVMSFSKLTRSNVHFHYKLWGSQIAEILHEHYDLEFSWREEFLQPLLDSVGEVSDHNLDNIYEMIGDWLTSLQKLIATFLMDLYAIVDGNNPFYMPKLDRVNVGLPEAVREKYIQPYAEILERVQKERIDAFNEELRRQQDAAYRQRQTELQKQRDEEARRKALNIPIPNTNLTLELAAIKEDDFQMGSNQNSNEQPIHPVHIKAFRIAKYTVTQELWKAVAAMPKVKDDLNADPSRFKGANLPVENVSWHDAQEFCKRLSNAIKQPVRLPTEAEWEYACRAGTNTHFAFGDTITPSQVNYDGNYPFGGAAKGQYRVTTVAVDSLAKNDWGLYQMHGNVWEWCEDVWHDNYNGAPSDGSAWMSGGDQSYRVLRGGSWSHYAGHCRSACRGRNIPSSRCNIYGFRVVLPLL